jgi:hypothetical protein
MTPLLGLVIACGASGWTDVSPESADGGRGGVMTDAGAGGAGGVGVPGTGGVIVPGAGGTAPGAGGGGGAGEEGGSSGSGGVASDAAPPLDDAPIIDPVEDTNPPPPPPPPDAGGDLFVPGDGAPNPTLSVGLVGRWKLDEGTGTATVDSSGTGNDGVIRGAAWVAGGFPAAKYANPGSLRFTNNDYVQLGTKNLPANNKPQTVTFWLNYTAVPGSDAQMCVTLTDGKSGGSRLKLGFKSQRLAAIKGGSSTNIVNTAPPAPGWHHFAYTFDGATHRLYIDGTFRVMSNAAPDTGAASNARLGGNYDASEGYTGFLDEVRIYDHPLAAPEIAALAAGEQ